MKRKKTLKRMKRNSMKNYTQIQYENISKTKEKREDRINPTKNLSIVEKENPIEYERQSKMNVKRKIIFCLQTSMKSIIIWPILIAKSSPFYLLQ